MPQYTVDYMEHALSLAELALGYTSPNPAVGAVIVKDGVVVGMGYTQPPGSAHAEIMALQQAGERANGATMYVILEPCCHQGRTSPCTQAIIDAGISVVHASMLDPNPQVFGKGVKRLKEAGIQVHIGEYEEKAKEINESYIKFITTGIPFVIAKFAMSLDGKIATRNGDSKWISNDHARRYIHKIRHIVDAVMVGVNTVIIDNPQLSARGCCSGRGGKIIMQPLRVIVDSKGRTPLVARVFKEPGKTIIAVTGPFDEGKTAQYKEVGAEVVEIPDKAKSGMVNLEKLLEVLGQRHITSILVEGGSQLLGSLFDEGLIDKIIVFIAPIIIGGEKASTAVAGSGVEKISEAFRLQNVKVQNLEDNVLVSGYVR